MASPAGALSIGRRACLPRQTSLSAGSDDTPSQGNMILLKPQPAKTPEHLYDRTNKMTLSTQTPVQAGARSCGPQPKKVRVVPCLPMPIRARHIAALVAAVLAGCSLGGCGTVNANLAAGVSDA